MSEARNDATSRDARPDAPEAVVLMLARNDRYLVIKRAPGVILPGYWTPLSGRIEPGETQRDALVREAREEIGLDVEPVAKVWECPTDDGLWKLHWWIVEAATDDLVPDPDEVEEVRWVTPVEFLELEPTFEGDREFFERVLPNVRLTDHE